jgi:hypothetical protein
MSAIEWSDVVALSADFADVSPGRQSDILSLVNSTLTVAMFSEEKLRMARIYLAAHHATPDLQGAVGASGPVISETVGPLTTAYAGGGVSLANLETTSYGKLYLSIVRTSLARLPVNL